MQKALETLYGPHIVFFDPQNDYNVEGAVEILLAASFAENQVEKYVILISRPIVGDCHSCGAPIEGAVFAKAGDRWQVEASNSVFGRQGSFGMAPPAQVIRIGPEKFGFLIFDTFATGGDDETQLVLYAAVNGNLKEILNVPLTLRIYPLDPNYVVPPLPDYTSRLRFVHGSNPVYDDLFLQVTEFREGSGLVNITKTYIFDGARYVLQN